MHFSKKLGRLSSAVPEILGFGSHCSAKFQPILDCFIPNSKLKNEDLGNIKAYWVNTIVVNFHQIKRRALFGTPGCMVSPLEIIFIIQTYQVEP